ncbi:hypothetical protein PVT68_18195 [Microbulbifer bruguierae]|uniref:Lipoprotein n=1 Tax=Microbulbifer bruguierae TaxID=3029061 RepID=A0ABY8NE02_9GAMM|nr:hypothetical protein [Microbulbifer bruguierae]WGL16669.1 hypothetical protein PVT68_18195 [Microbulbifer bruguierae]
MKKIVVFTLVVAISIFGCAAVEKKPVVMEVIYPEEALHGSPAEAVVNIIHDTRSVASLKNIARSVPSDLISCETGSVVKEWQDDNTASPHKDFPEGQNSVSLVLRCE